jgi:hypothetical protein
LIERLAKSLKTVAAKEVGAEGLISSIPVGDSSLIERLAKSLKAVAA